MVWGYRAPTLLTLIFLAAIFYETSNITRSLKSFIVSPTLGRRGFSQAFLGQKDFQWQEVMALLANLGKEVSLSPNIYLYRYGLPNHWSFVPALVILNARGSVCLWTGIQHIWALTPILQLL